jgi:hypothetical protein
MKLRLTRVTIVYKSGATMTLRCQSFTVKLSRLDGEITALEWKRALPQPLCAGVEEVAAVFSGPVWRR